MVGGGLERLPWSSQIINSSSKKLTDSSDSFCLLLWYLVRPPLFLYHLQPSPLPPSFTLSVCASLRFFSSVSYSGGVLFEWPPAHHDVQYNNSTQCAGLIFVYLRAMWGLCLSFSMTAAYTYLPFYFEAWLMGWQPWHACRHCGTCYYRYINILISTWLAIEEIITCHHSTAKKECTMFYECAHAHTFPCLFHPANMISFPLIPLCPLMSSTVIPFICAIIMIFLENT